MGAGYEGSIWEPMEETQKPNNNICRVKKSHHTAMKNLSKKALTLSAMAAMMAGTNTPTEIPKGAIGDRKIPLTKKQKKVRAKNKLQKQSRKINRKK